MSLQVPTIAEIRDNLIAQIESELGTTIPLLSKSFSRVLATALAAVFVLLYKYTGWTFLQIFATTAQFEEVEVNGRLVSPLIEWGRLIGVGDPTPATRAELLVDVDVQQPIGALAAGSLLLKDTTGVTYSVITATLLNDNPIQVPIQAVDDEEGNLGAGTIGNLGVGDTLNFANPIPFVAREVRVADILLTAADEETEDDYRNRVVTRFRRRPQGGALADYLAWALEVPGVLNAYPYTGVPGQVIVYVEATVASSGSPDGIPTQAQLDAVKQSLLFDLEGNATRAPAGVTVATLPITRTVVDVTVTGLVVDDVASVTTDMNDDLDEYLRTLEPFIVGISALPARNQIFSADLAGIASAVIRASGGTFTSITASQGGTDITQRILDDGTRAKLGSLTVTEG